MEGYAELTYLNSLSEAQADPDGVVIFEGDMGGQIYLTARADHIKCSEWALSDLLLSIEMSGYGFSEPENRSLTFASCDRDPENDCIIGGMGGGIVNDSIWIHEDLRPIADKIMAVLNNEQMFLQGV